MCMPKIAELDVALIVVVSLKSGGVGRMCHMLPLLLLQIV